MSETQVMTKSKHVFNKHRGPVTCATHLPTKNAVVTSGYDGAIGWFNFDTDDIKLLGYHEHLANRIVVNSDGTRAASCSSDYTIKIWNLSTFNLEKTLYGHSDDVEDFIFVDDHTGVSASRDQRILIWNLDTGAITRVIDGHEKDVLSLAYHDGKIYSSGDDKTLRVWDLQTGNLLNMWGPFEVETDTCAIDTNHGRVILGCDDGCIRVFDIKDGKMIREIAAHESGIKKVSVSPVNGDILSAAYDQKILVWDADSLSLKLNLEQNQIKWERSLNFSSDGQKVYAGTFDGTVLCWDAITGQFLSEIGRHEEVKGNACFNDVAADHEGKLALVSDDGYMRLADLNSGEDMAIFEPTSGRFLMNGVAMSAKYNLVVGGAHNQRIHIFKEDQGQLQQTAEALIGEGPINTIRISEHQGYEQASFVGCYSGAIVRVNEKGEIMDKLEVHDGAVKALRLHPYQPLGVSCSAEGELLSWNFNGEVVQQYLGHTAIINDVDISPSGKYAASVSRDFSVKVFELDTGKLLYSYNLGRKSLKSVSFIDELTVVVGDYWGNIVKVDLESGDITRQTLARNGISSITRYDRYFIAVSYDGSVNVVDSNLTIVKKILAMAQRIQ
ncbi:WD40 repeat domain-containing protein [Caldalkalibacillus salinus]|uniref:WD40 repeat domain-containing protein n=1 Tax=Caldalkalibacillus salinus TaxID=2803787 RepID=UPI001924C9CE|nr:WD40 repeat domain-containing protein [Caldalkalibacillus salinus]